MEILYQCKEDHEAVALATKVIEDYPENHWHLADAKIIFLICEMGKNGEKQILSEAKKVSGMLRFFTECDFIICLHEPWWIEASAERREALIDHELTHCGWKENKNGEPVMNYNTGEELAIVYTLRPHDYTEFLHLISRYGAMMPGAFDEVAEAVAKQRHFKFADAVDEKKQQMEKNRIKLRVPFEDGGEVEGKAADEKVAQCEGG